MPRRQFTVAEVDRLIPSLERIFLDVLQLHAALRRCEASLGELGVTPTREIASGEDADGSPGVTQAKAMFRAYHETLRDALAQIADLGGEVKDAEAGLVDFPGRRGRQDIWLCWRLGEKHVAHWHPEGTGFAGRRPLEKRVPTPRPRPD